MTFKEKLAMEHPDKLDPAEAGGCIDCPVDYGYESEDKCVLACHTHTCKQCWDRKIPETEKIKKENKTMATTRKTKDELLKELEEAKELITTLEKELKDLEKCKQYDECADQLAAMRDSFIKAGFDKNEAFALVQQILANTI